MSTNPKLRHWLPFRHRRGASLGRAVVPTHLCMVDTHRSTPMQPGVRLQCRVQAMSVAPRSTKSQSLRRIVAKL